MKKLIFISVIIFIGILTAVVRNLIYKTYFRKSKQQIENPNNPVIKKQANNMLISDSNKMNEKLKQSLKTQIVLSLFFICIGIYSLVILIENINNQKLDKIGDIPNGFIINFVGPFAIIMGVYMLVKAMLTIKSFWK